MFITSLKKITVSSIMLVALCAVNTPLVKGAPFVVSWGADTASANVVKLVKIGSAYTDPEPNVFIMTWNATRQLYETTSIDEATFVNGKYRIYDGSGTIAVDTLVINSNIIDADQIEDKFLRNDGDDTMRGALTVRPASGSDNAELSIDNSSGMLILSAQDTSGGSTAGHTLRLQAASVDLQTSAGSSIKITGVASGSTTGDAVAYEQLSATQGIGWSSIYDIMDLNARLVALEGTGNFTANDTLNLTGAGFSGGIRINWAFDPVAVNDSVLRYEVYYGAAAVPGYAQSGAAGLSSATLSLIRSSLNRMGLPEPTSLSTTLNTIYDWYVIVVAFDFDGTAWGSNQVLVSSGNVVDGTVPLIGDATSVSGALGTLANEINDVKVSIGESGFTKVLFASNTASASASATLVEYYNPLAAASNNVVCSYYKSDMFDKVRLSGQGRHSAAGGDYGKYYLVVSTLSTSTQVATTAATDFTLELDCSSLATGWYQVTMQITDSDNSTADTAYVKYVTIESLNNQP